MRSTIDPGLILIIAGEAHADPRTVRRRLDGKPVKPLTQARIDAVLDRRGLLSDSTPPHEAA